jgi:hypothetical protein
MDALRRRIDIAHFKPQSFTKAPGRRMVRE